MKIIFFLFIFILFISNRCYAIELQIFPEFFRLDPFGNIVAVDWQLTQPTQMFTNKDGFIVFKAVKNGYISFHLAVCNETGSKFTISAKTQTSTVEVNLFREWFHKNKTNNLYYADALIPVKTGSEFSIPDPQMNIKGQKMAIFWVDIWISPESKSNKVPITFEIKSNTDIVLSEIMLDILDGTVPNEDAIIADHNTYGIEWVSRYFSLRKKNIEDKGDTFTKSNAFFESIHDTYRFLYEHRGTLHYLGYSHTGKVNPLFVPELEGEGVKKRIKSWETFDKHFGNLLDGSAFKNTRRGICPIGFIYLPITPEWPANYLNFATDVYESEFVNVVSAMEKHFNEKGWTKTNFEMFFNHKKRYKSFEWDGDETRFSKDNIYFKEFGRLLQKAIPEDSPVSFVFRHDASWLMRQQMDELAGIVNMWVCSGGIFCFYPEAPSLLKGRGDIVWVYGGLPSHFEPLCEILNLPLCTWMQGIDGYLRWSTTEPGDDPWFNSDGGTQAMFFPGDKFGIDGPIPSIRLKIQRNCLQDIALLKLMEENGFNSKELRNKISLFADESTLEDWWNGNVEIKKQDPIEWSNASLREAIRPSLHKTKKIDGRWWLAAREFILSQISNLKSVKNKDVAFYKSTTKRRKDLQPYRIENKINPAMPKELIQGDVKEQIMKLANLCVTLINGDDCWNIVTNRAEEWLFKKHPKDKYFADDNYDVNPEQFIKVKKDLIKLSKLVTFPVDCNLWMRTKIKPEKVHMVIRQVNGFSQWYSFGQFQIKPAEDMKKVLAGEIVVVEGIMPNKISVLAPIKNNAGEIVGFVEVCTKKEFFY